MVTFVRRLGIRPTAGERSDVAERRSRLQEQIDDFQKKAVEFWGPPADFEDDEWEDIRCYEDSNIMSSDSEDDSDDVFSASSPLDTPAAPERRPLFLPSNLGVDICTKLGYSSFVQQEMRLRIGQANDALYGLRLSLSRKAVIFRDGLRSAKSKVKKMRSWHQIVQIDAGARHQARLYGRAREAMCRLGATAEQLDRYQLLTRKHMSITTAKIDPSQRGQRNTSLAWFWTMDAKSDTEAVEGMAECECTPIEFMNGFSHQPQFTVFIG
jgi:hypothetical protein